MEGSSITALNSVLALAIISDKSMRQRKELLFIIGLAIADALYGLGCIDAGRDRLTNLVISNVTDYTPLNCFFKPREWLINYASQVHFVLYYSWFFTCSFVLQLARNVTYYNWIAKYINYRLRFIMKINNE